MDKLQSIVLFHQHLSIRVSEILIQLEQIQNNLLLRAKRQLEDNITEAANYDTLKSVLDKKGGFVSAGWCGDQRCEDIIKQETGADIRLIPFEGQEDSESKVCIYCSKPSKKTAIFARAY